MRRLTLILVAVTCLANCWTTRIVFDRQSMATGEHNNEWDGRWYHSIIYSLVELSGPIPVETLCPHGISYADQESSFLNGLVESLTWEIYNPQLVTIYCANGGAAHAVLENDAMVAYQVIDERGLADLHEYTKH